MRRSLGIYVHIPFCARKCRYCDFLSFAADEAVKERYIQALLGEIEAAPVKFAFAPGEYEIRTVYIGGGTPSCIEEVYIKKILCKLYEVFSIPRENDIEITLEANPGTVDRDKLRVYRDAGVNRLSLGLQSTDERELRVLGRIHTFAEFEASFLAAREAGFSNINADIMTALPGQTREILEDTLCKLIRLEPEHISAYSLIIEEGTPFYALYGTTEEKASGKTEEVVNGGNGLPSEEEERALYYFVRDELKEHGYMQYEISNFAQEGYASRHNTAYWKRIPYLGLGLGAASLINEIRYRNTTDFKTYLARSGEKGAFIEEIQLSLQDRMEETMFLGLRMREGVSKAYFRDCYGKSMEAVYEKELVSLERDGLIVNTPERIYLTDRGIDYGNYVFSRFLLT